MPTHTIVRFAITICIGSGFISICSGGETRASGEREWRCVGHDSGGMRYSPLDQINKDNVSRLKVAWTYHTADAGKGTTIECTPIVVEGVMYVTTVLTKILALDAATGQKKWLFDPYTDTSKSYLRSCGGVNRGLAYWSDGKSGGQRRILAGLTDARLICLDARTGQLDAQFADGGQLDLRKAIDYDTANMTYGPTSAPLVFDDLVFLGFATDEVMPSAPGDIRAFDVRTGKERWRFHTIPHPGEFAYDTWPPDAWKNRGGANPWGGFTLDEKTGTLFCGTGSAAADFYGGDRAGNNLFANCVLALDARTGRRLWHFQTVHHDLWDHDLPCPPVVTTFLRNGKTVDAVAQVTKSGYCFLLDRRSGEPLYPVREVPASASDLPGEAASPTQPVPDRPPALARQVFTDDEITDISPQAHTSVVNQLRTLRYGRPYMTPSVPGTVVIPGFHGGATWCGASYDPTSGYLFVNTNERPTIVRVHPSEPSGFAFDGYTFFADEAGYPAIKPPWGKLTAIDLKTGEFAWQVPLGEFAELKAKGVPQTGTESFGGTIVTAGGLVFIGGSKDAKMHAFDKSSGKLLWSYQLNAGGYATPCTYEANGRQFVVIAAGGGGKPMTKTGDEFVAFALPWKGKSKSRSE